ncbi:unnamed protein product [Adineta steineri]|uniref:Ubiquitin-like domain-containing protein n=4 Tax=Adineta steineri TaxID=433720 RepID=A0A818KJF1_9BILA|nr:unnamed protein product [Adineta steineri]
MGTTYKYTYEYEVQDPTKHTRTTGGNNPGNSTQRSVAPTTHLGVGHAHTSRSNPNDPLANLQHDPIWNKLYDPSNMNQAAHNADIQLNIIKMFSDGPARSANDQKMARRQDRKIIKLEAAYGSDRQTFIVKRDYELHVRDVTDEAGKQFKIPSDQVILFWKGRNICERPDELLETLGIENNNTMRICRADDQNQKYMQQHTVYQQGPPSGSYGQQPQQQYGSNGNYAQQGAPSSSGSDFYNQQQSYNPQNQQVYYSNPGGYDQQQYTSGGSSGQPCNCNCHQDQRKCCCQGYGSTNHYQQLTNQTISTPAIATYIISLQIGLGDRIQGLAIGRSHPITLYDLQVELQQHFNVPVLQQNLSFNGMPLMHLPPDTSLQTIGITNNAFISLWYRNNIYIDQQQIADYFTPRQQQNADYITPRQQEMSSYYYDDGSQSLRSSSGDVSSRRMYNSNSGNELVKNGTNQQVIKIEVFHGSDRHVITLRSSSNIRISDLMEELQKITTVPIQNQRLYYRGQELQTMKQSSLQDVGLDNNSQVRLIGEPTKSRYLPLMTSN